MDTSKNKEYQKEWKAKNKEKLKQYQKEWRANNKEKLKEYHKKYLENNREELNQYRNKYNKTENGKKYQRIQTWKSRGVISDNWEDTYENYINCKNCEICNIELDTGNKRNGRVLDHDHITGNIRNIICRCCNNKLPKQKILKY